MKIIQKFQTLLQARKDRKLSVERITAKEKIKDTLVFSLSGFPVCICHRYLVQICNIMQSFLI